MNRDDELLRAAIALARRCPPSTTFRVGAVVTDASGAVVARGWSGRDDPADHAEECALRDVAGAAVGRTAAGGTVYSSLEPCGERSSRPLTCTQHILAAGVARVVYAWREPELFVAGEGHELLRAAGVDVVERADLAPLVRAANRHLPGVAP